MKQYYLFFGFWLICIQLVGQQLPQTTMHWFNPFQYHVASAGSEQTLVATATYRKQWSGLNGAPETQMINGHLPLGIIRSGLGIRLQNDRIGAHGIASASLAYSYHIVQAKRFQLSAGIGADISQFSLDGSKLRAPDGTYQESTGLFTHNDDFLSESIVKTNGFGLEFGLWLQSERLSVGLSAIPSLSSPYQLASGKVLEIKRPAHYICSVSYLFPVGEIFELQPGIFVKTDALRTQSDIFCKVNLKQNIFGGVSVRGFNPLESISFFGGGRINQTMVLGYAYDSVFSPLNSTSTGSHEISLRYTLSKPLGVGKLPPMIYNPRFL
jgi:type IX secretion system PorP/SprF family membrane protein